MVKLITQSSKCKACTHPWAQHELLPCAKGCGCRCFVPLSSERNVEDVPLLERAKWNKTTYEEEDN